MMATQGIDFKKLSLMDALDLAVLIEEEARDRYEELAEQLEVHHTPEAARFFRKMIRIEEKHRSDLLAKRKQRFGDSPSKMRREMLFDVEAPEYDEVRAEMTPRQALETALHSEIKAHDFFAVALKSLKDPQVVELFEALRDEELEHQKLVKLEMKALPAQKELKGDVADADEPVAH